MTPSIETFNLAMAVFLFANLLLALWRVTRGPTPADRLLAVLLFGTTGVALLLLLAHAGGGEALVAGLVDVALVFALLAAITGTAFALRAWRQEEDDERP